MDVPPDCAVVSSGSQWCSGIDRVMVAVNCGLVHAEPHQTGLLVAAGAGCCRWVAMGGTGTWPCGSSSRGGRGWLRPCRCVNSGPILIRLFRV